MQKAQAVSPSSKLTQELITFPGYAGILIGWLSVVGFLAWWLVEKFMSNSAPQPLVIEIITVEPSGGPSVAVVVLSVAIIAVMVAAVWVYVARWTKTALVTVARAFRVKAEQYWAFCTIALLVGWIAAAGLLYVASGDVYVGEFLFLSAAVISCGALSFGVAALKGLEGLQADKAFSFAFSGAQSRKPANSKKAKKASKRTTKKDAVLRKKADPNA